MCVGMHTNLSLKVILTSCLFHIVWFQAQHQKRKKKKRLLEKIDRQGEGETERQRARENKR